MLNPHVNPSAGPAQQRLTHALAGQPSPALSPPEQPRRNSSAADPAGPAGDQPTAAPGSLIERATRLRLAGTAFDPGRPGLRALAVIAVVVVIAAAVLAWWSQPRPAPVGPQLTQPQLSATPTEPAELVVAVTGQVREPGLVRLPPGARVADAIEAAGGLLPDADIDHLNLARKVADGELIPVGVPPPAGEPAGGLTGGKLNLNLATAAQLETLPGIGPALAARIIAYRTEHGPFSAVEQLRQVSGIGEVRFQELAELVTV